MDKLAEVSGTVYMRQPVSDVQVYLTPIMQWGGGHCVFIFEERVKLGSRKILCLIYNEWIYVKFCSPAIVCGNQIISDLILLC